MKKSILFTTISFLLATAISFGQNINLPADSVATLLCKKWEVDFAIMGGMKIGMIPGAPEVNYEFKKDKTYFMTSKDSKDKVKGTWNYDTRKKIIKLTSDGKNSINIISLKDGELIMLVNTQDVTPDDPTELKMVYKVKTE
jgi:hypothetical protein